MRTVRVSIEGRVQGVFFRAWTQQTARALRLGGWVRNRHDGSVEAAFSGSDEDVAAMVARCGDGPPAAHVDRVRILSDELSGEPGDFRVLPTR